MKLICCVLLLPLSSKKYTRNGLLNVDYSIKMIFTDRINDYDTEEEIVNISELDNKVNQFIIGLEEANLVLLDINSDNYHRYNETSTILNAIIVTFTIRTHLNVDYCA